MRTNNNENIKEFYNNYDKKLLSDYLNGNPRLEAAINDALKLIDFSSKKILDIGCGIGWSSNEFSKIAKFVHGVDLSPVLIDVANQLFDKVNLEYSTIDITNSHNNFISNYEIVTLLDVFEHIPETERVNFYKSVNSVLNSSGAVYITCPSKYHQSWLRKNKPEGLQPVDEDVDILTLTEFGSHLDGGEVIYFKYVSIWEPNDYFHAILQKTPVSCRLNNFKTSLEPFRSRIRRVKKLNNEYQYFSRKEFEMILKRAQKYRNERIKEGFKKFM